jgi:hypothetical protein
MSRTFFTLLVLTLCFGCGSEDIMNPYEARDTSEVEPPCLDMGYEEDVPETDASTPEADAYEAPQRSAWCEEKLRRDCEAMSFAVFNGFIDPELYYYLCHGAGRDRYQC